MDKGRGCQCSTNREKGRRERRKKGREREKERRKEREKGAKQRHTCTHIHTHIKKYNRKRDTDVQKRLWDSVGEGEVGCFERTASKHVYYLG